MLNLKFQAPAPHDILLTVVWECHTLNKEKVKSCGILVEGKKQNRFHTLCLFVLFFIGETTKMPKIHTNVYTHSARNVATEIQMPHS